jgi:hypothetical protein
VASNDRSLHAAVCMADHDVLTMQYSMRVHCACMWHIYAAASAWAAVAGELCPQLACYSLAACGQSALVASATGYWRPHGPCTSVSLLLYCWVVSGTASILKGTRYCGNTKRSSAGCLFAGVRWFQWGRLKSRLCHSCTVGTLPAMSLQHAVLGEKERLLT